MTTPHRVTIDSIEPRAWRVRLRDHATGESHEVELRGDGPWQLSINGKPEVAAAPPPDSAITLRLDNQSAGKTVRVAAVGRGAIAWAQAQRSLMGATWQTDDKGAPELELVDSPTLVLDLQKALPEVTLDLSRYEGASKPAAVRTGAKVKAETPASDDAITLRLESTAEGVRVLATGRGAIAWAEREGTLLGAKWFRDAKGRPQVLLEDRPGLASEIQKLHPKVTLDLAKYTAAPARGKPTPASDMPATSRKAAAEPKSAKKVPEPEGEQARGRERDGAAKSRKAAAEPEKPAKAAPAPAPEATKESPRRRAAAAETPTSAASPSSEPPTPSAPKGRKKTPPTPGSGPGGLEWAPLADHEREGLVARWKDGAFKLFHAGGDRYALFYEHDSGGYETLSCGTLEDVKRIAGERVTGTNTAVPLDARIAQVACATAPKTGPVKSEDITLHLRRSELDRAVVIIRATGDRVHEWAFHHKSVLGSAWNLGEDGLPEAHKLEASTLVANLRKEFPGVKIDTTAYTEPKADSDGEAKKSEAKKPEAPPPPEPAPAPAEEHPADGQASADRELMADFRKELASIFDEEDD